jgi:hypothetical protein
MEKSGMDIGQGRIGFRALGELMGVQWEKFWPLIRLFWRVEQLGEL